MILYREFLKALEKNTLSFFLRWVFRGWQKNESVFLCVGKKLN